jgi:hypothetical protein
MRDFIGNELNVGDRVAKAARHGSIAVLEDRVVERIENGKLYLQREKPWGFKEGDKLPKNSVHCDPDKVVKIA